MACAVGPEICVYRGDTYEAVYTVTDGTDPIDITGYVINFSVKKSLSSETKDVDVNAALTDTVNGIATLTLTEDDTDIEAQSYYYDVEFRSPSSTTVKTYQGKFKVKADVA